MKKMLDLAWIWMKVEISNLFDMLCKINVEFTYLKCTYVIDNFQDSNFSFCISNSVLPVPSDQSKCCYLKAVIVSDGCYKFFLKKYVTP